MKYFILLLFPIFLLSCGSDTANKSKFKGADWSFLNELRGELAQKAEKDGGFQFKSEEELCKLLNPQKIEEIFKIPASEITHVTRDYIFESPISASCVAQFKTASGNTHSLILEMYCNERVKPDNHVGDMFLGEQMRRDFSEHFPGNEEKYNFHEISGIGDRAVESRGVGKIVWYVGNYVIYTLQYQTRTADNSGHSKEMKQLAEYITAGTLETLH